MADAQALIDAIRTNNTKALETMIADGQNINIRNEKENTLLHIAAYYGHVDVCRMLLAAGADMHAENKDGCSAMQMAADRVIHPTPDDNGQRAMMLLAVFVNHNAQSTTDPSTENTTDNMSDTNGVIEAIDKAMGIVQTNLGEKREIESISEEASSSEDIASEMLKTPKTEEKTDEAPKAQTAPATEAPQAAVAPASPAPKAESALSTEAAPAIPETPKVEATPATPPAPKAEAPSAPQTPEAEATLASPTLKAETAPVAPEAPKAEAAPVAPKTQAPPAEAPKVEEAPSEQTPKAASA